MNIIGSRSEQEKESERSLNFSVLGQMVPLYPWLPFWFGARFLCPDNHLHPPFILPCCHPLQDVARMSKRKTQRQPCLHKTLHFSLCLKTKWTHWGLSGGAFPHHSQHFKGLGTVFCHMAGSIKLCSIPLHLPFFSFSFVKCSQFQEIVIQNVGEVTEFWLRRSCRCCAPKEDDHDRYVLMAINRLGSQKFSYSRMYKPFSYWKKTPVG